MLEVQWVGYVKMRQSENSYANVICIVYWSAHIIPLTTVCKRLRRYKCCNIVAYTSNVAENYVTVRPCISSIEIYYEVQ